MILPPKSYVNINNPLIFENIELVRKFLRNNDNSDDKNSDFWKDKSNALMLSNTHHPVRQSKKGYIQSHPNKLPTQAFRYGHCHGLGHLKRMCKTEIWA